MISVVDKEIIRRLYQKQGKSMRWIARELKMSRKTVRKAIFDESEPKYNLTQPKPKPVTDMILPIIKGWLEEEKDYPLKQHYTAKRIYERLAEEGRRLTLKAYVYRVEIYGDRKLVAVHPRTYVKDKENFCLDHYLDTLIKKPGALEHAKPFKNANLPAIYHHYLQEFKRRHPRPEREFVQILLLHRMVGWDVLTKTLTEAYQEGIYHLEGVRHRAEKLSGKHIIPTPLPEGQHPYLQTYKVTKPELNQFNQLLNL